MAIKIQGSTIIDDSRKVINASHVGIGTTNPTVELDVDGQANISGIVTAAKYVVEGGSSTGFLKADGSIDSTPYATGTGTLDSIVIKNNGQNVGSSSTFTSLDFYNGIGVSTTGVVGVASISLEDNISISGIFTAASFSGSGSGLTSIPTSALVGLATDADKLDGQHGSYYLDYDNFINTPPDVRWFGTAVGIWTSSSVGIGTTTLDDSDLVGVGNSFQGLYIRNGMMIVDNSLDGDHYIGTNFNGLMAGPVTVNGTLTVDGNWVVV